MNTNPTTNTTATAATAANRTGRARRAVYATALAAAGALFLIGCSSPGRELAVSQESEVPSTTASSPAPAPEAPVSPVPSTRPAATPVAVPAPAPAPSTVPSTTKVPASSPSSVHPLASAKAGDCLTAPSTVGTTVSVRNLVSCVSPSAAVQIVKVSAAPGLVCGTGESTYRDTYTSGGSSSTITVCYVTPKDRDNVLAVGSCVSVQKSATAGKLDVYEKPCTDLSATAKVTTLVAAGTPCPAGTLHRFDQSQKEAAGAVIGEWCVAAR